MESVVERLLELELPPAHAARLSGKSGQPLSGTSRWVASRDLGALVQLVRSRTIVLTSATRLARTGVRVPTRAITTRTLRFH